MVGFISALLLFNSAQADPCPPRSLQKWLERRSSDVPLALPPAPKDFATRARLETLVQSVKLGERKFDFSEDALRHVAQHFSATEGQGSGSAITAWASPAELLTSPAIRGALKHVLPAANAGRSSAELSLLLKGTGVSVRECDPKSGRLVMSVRSHHVVGKNSVVPLNGQAWNVVPRGRAGFGVAVAVGEAVPTHEVNLVFGPTQAKPNEIALITAFSGAYAPPQVPTDLLMQIVGKPQAGVYAATEAWLESLQKTSPEKAKFFPSQVVHEAADFWSKHRILVSDSAAMEVPRAVALAPKASQVQVHGKSWGIKGIQQTATRGDHRVHTTLMEMSVSEVPWNVNQAWRDRAFSENTPGSKFGKSFSNPDEVTAVLKASLPERVPWSFDGRNYRAELTLEFEEAVGSLGILSMAQVQEGLEKSAMVARAKDPKAEVQRLMQTLVRPREEPGVPAELALIDTVEGIRGHWYPEMAPDPASGVFTVVVDESGKPKNPKFKFVADVPVFSVPPEMAQDLTATHKFTAIFQWDAKTQKPYLLAAFPGENSPELPTLLPAYAIHSTSPGSPAREYWSTRALVEPRNPPRKGVASLTLAFRCGGCPDQVIVSAETLKHSRLHFGSQAPAGFSGRPKTSTSMFPADILPEDVVTALNGSTGWMPDKKLHSALETQPAAVLPSAIAYDNKVTIKGRQYDMRIAICVQHPNCWDGTQLYRPGEIITIFPLKGPDVVVLPALGK